MARKPTYKELEQRIADLEKESSKRKRMEDVLGEFLEFKEKVISESPIGMSIYDASGQCVAANDSIGRIIGATKEQVLEQNYNHIESWKKTDMLYKAKSAIRENSKKRHELIIKSTFGKDVSLDCHLVPFSSGGQNHLLLMINDISERIRAEGALKRLADEQTILLTTVPAMIFWIDKEGDFIRVNEPFAAALQKSPDEIEGKSLFDLYPKDQARKFHSDNLEVIESGNPKKNIEERVQTPAGTMWVRTEKIPYRDKKRNDAGIIGFSVDITERKRAEDALREREAALEIRTNELEEANTALKVLLKQREEDKTEVEQKMVLNVKELVLPYAEKLNETSLDEQQIAYLKILESNLKDIISPFTYKLSSKAFGLTPKEIQVANLVRDGRTSKEIAQLFNVSVKAVEFHRNRIRAKRNRCAKTAE